MPSSHRATRRSPRRAPRHLPAIVALTVAAGVVAGGVVVLRSPGGASTTLLAGAVPPGAAAADVADGSSPTSSSSSAAAPTSDPASEASVAAPAWTPTKRTFVVRTRTPIPPYRTTRTTGAPTSAPGTTATTSTSTSAPTATTPDDQSSSSSSTPSSSSSTSKSSAPAGNSSYAQQVLTLTNAQRTANGCAPLAWNTTLASVAQAHSEDMAENNYFAHNSQNGRTAFDRMSAAGYTYSYAAENIAAGQPTPQAVVDAWMNSPGHRENILNCKLTQLGVGYAKGGSYGSYWTQDFGTPR